jgi:hypothetical protein
MALNVQTVGGCLANVRCVVSGQTGEGSSRGTDGGGKCSGIGGVEIGEFLIKRAGWCCGGKCISGRNAVVNFERRRPP